MAMNLNDLLMKRAIPYAIVDHLFLPKDDKEAIIKIMRSLTKECKKRNIAITGGETAIHDTKDELELSITMLGFIKNPKPNKFEIGDTLVGIKSNGLHSNGFTKIREIFKDYKPEFTAPTYIYSDVLFDLDKKFDIHGMVHITGGAYTKLKDLSPYADSQITRHKLEPQKIFKELHKRGISDKEMYKTFNCGVGFILSVLPQDSAEIISNINEKGFKADIIGKIIPGNGKVKLESMFSDKEIKF